MVLGRLRVVPVIFQVLHPGGDRDFVYAQRLVDVLGLIPDIDELDPDGPFIIRALDAEEIVSLHVLDYDDLAFQFGDRSLPDGFTLTGCDDDAYLYLRMPVWAWLDYLEGLDETSICSTRWEY